jgi:hypothetical protein
MVWLAVSLCLGIASSGAEPMSLGDDAPLLQAKLNGAHKLELRPGYIYNVASSIVIRGGPVVIVGNHATLRAANSLRVADAGGDILRLVGCSDIQIRDVVFDQNRSHRGASLPCNPVAVRLLGCRNFSILGCTFSDSPADSIRVAAMDPKDAATACHDGRIDHNVFAGAYRNGISVIGGASLRIDHNSFADITGGQSPNAAIDIEPNAGDAPGIDHDITFDTNAIAHCGIGAAIYNHTAGTHDVSIANNAITECQHGIISEGFKTQIAGNALTGCGIGVQNSDAANVSGNVLVNGSIYLDTHNVANPAGHEVSQNIAGEIDAHYCYGHVRLGGNVAKIEQ